MNTGEVPMNSSRQPAFVIGIDVGGTFTDAVCSDGSSTWRAKAPTNPERFGQGVLDDCAILAQQIGISREELLCRTERFGLGTTAVTNVLATRRGRTVGLITTAGFENHLHAMRNHRDVIDGWLTMPWNPVHLDAVRGLTERVDRNGTILKPLDLRQVEAAARDLAENEGVDAFAVSLLWSVRNPGHEQAAVRLIRELYPDFPVFSGVELHPLVREYERTTLAVLNAFTADALDGVEELQGELKLHGLKVPVLLLHSGGGAMTVAQARAKPLALASSGPAAGAVAAGEVAVLAGLPNALCCDMGGPSIDVAVVAGGIPERSQSTRIGGIVTGQSAVDVESIGAGGGSIAWIDSRAMLRVGPHSARATPGPVCYGRGGTEPTVTDAMILLGYIDPARFMGGAMKLDVEAARQACEDLGRTIGMSALEIAYGIREIAQAEMAKALRARISRGGIDAREFGVIAFGGSGSLFATSLARELGLAWVLTPAVASVLSAFGAATADIRIEIARAVDEILLPDSISAAPMLAELMEQAHQALAAQGVAHENREMMCEAELRFYRQRDCVTLELDEQGLEPGKLLDRFREAYATRYGDSSLTAQATVELSTLRVIGIGSTTRASLPSDTDPVIPGSRPDPVATRLVVVTPERTLPVPVHEAHTVHPGHVIAGPALIDAGDTTLWVPQGAHVEVATGGSLLTTFKEMTYG